MGVYLGPAEPFGARGHLVYTANDRLRTVSHVLVDYSTKPFQMGMLTELLKKSARVTSVYDKAHVDPQTFIMKNGESAFNFIGQRVLKEFDSTVYRGRVTRVIPPEDDEAQDAELYFQIVYEDGDVEDLTFDELRQILIHKGKQPAMAAASMSAETILDDEDDDHTDDSSKPVRGTDVPLATVLQDYQELVFLASRRVAAASLRSNTAANSELPFGETYSWMKIFKMSRSERDKHVQAMQAEIDKLTSAHHARWEHLPPGEIAIPSVGVFRVKEHDLHAGGHTLKARFCANGQAVVEPPGGWDSTANVASYSQILTVLAIATQLGLKLAQIDVKSAFTQVKLRSDQRIWIKPLPGLGDPAKEGRVLRLLHHLYGHPLANAAFQELWVSIMQEFGFVVVDSAKTVFSYEKDGKRMFVATVVDDSVVAYSDDTLYEEFKNYLRSRVPISESPLDTICGMRVVRNADGSTSIDQQEYIEKKAKAFNCEVQGTPFKSPMASDFKLGVRPEVPDKELVSYARELMGSLIYATLTRHECKYACSKLASVAVNPTRSDISAMERILKYLYASRYTKLTFKKGPWRGPDGYEHGVLEPAVYVDASFAQETGRRSQTGFAVFLAGAAIFAKSGKQTQQTDSTGYSETIALHEASNWVILLRNHMSRMFGTRPQFADKVLSKPTRIYEDNAAAVTFADKGPGLRSLHWDVKLQYVHELQSVRRIIQVVPIDTRLQCADILTKALDITQHLRLSTHLLGGPVIFH